ncbi:MAG: sensor histidine kinase [Anaerolineales bacterium]
MSAQTNTILSVLEAELNRIVLDIHDGPVQNLFAALSLLTQLQHDLDQHPDDERLSAQLQQVSEIIESTLREIKFFLGTFRSPGFRDRPLKRLVHSLVMQHEDWTGQTVELDADDLRADVALLTKIALYRILQEALSNGYRHAATDYQYVRLWSEDDLVCLEVRDDGQGFDPPDLSADDEALNERHIGLRGMRDRIHLVGGEFALHSTRGQGTTILVKAPAL